MNNKDQILLIPRADPLLHPVGKIKYNPETTSFSEYVRSYFEQKHPESTIPPLGNSVNGKGVIGRRV